MKETTKDLSKQVLFSKMSARKTPIVCNFCKKPGHHVKDCTTLKDAVCSRCTCKGHTKLRCPKTDTEIQFPPLASGKAIPTPSPKKPLPPKVNVASKPPAQQPNRYKLEVQQRVAFWISTAITILGSMWFREYKKSAKKNYTDPFLTAVQSEVSDTVEQLLFEEELEKEDAYYRAEFENAKREAKKKAEREALKNSMTENEWDLYTQNEWDLFANDMSDYDHYYYPFEQRKADARKVEALADWSAFLTQEEKFQEEFRERQSMKSHIGRPRNGLTLGSFM